MGRAVELLRCVWCGNLVIAVRRGSAVEPIREACPECDGTAFEEIQSAGG